MLAHHVLRIREGKKQSATAKPRPPATPQQSGECVLFYGCMLCLNQYSFLSSYVHNIDCELIVYMWPGTAEKSQPAIPVHVDAVETQVIDIQEAPSPPEPPKVEPSPERSSSERRASYQTVEQKDLSNTMESGPGQGSVPEKVVEPPTASHGKVKDQEKEVFTDEAGWMDVQGVDGLEQRV